MKGWDTRITVKGQEVQRVGSPGKHALPLMVFWVDFIRGFVGFLLAAQKGLNILNALCVRRGNHFRHFNNPMPLQLPVYVIIV